MTALLLDTHVIVWLDSQPERLSAAANAVIESADELMVAGISWFELAWLVQRGRILPDLPLAAWLASLSEDTRTLGITPSIARTAALLPGTFPGDPADRLIFATAIEHGIPIVSKDRQMHEHASLGPEVIW